MPPKSPEGSVRPQSPLQSTSDGGGGGKAPPSGCITFAAAAAPSVTPQLVSELKEEANRKVSARFVLHRLALRWATEVEVNQ